MVSLRIRLSTASQFWYDFHCNFPLQWVSTLIQKHKTRVAKFYIQFRAFMTERLLGYITTHIETFF
jgi:predicted DCC family thiol-disulfide oxidoreductase YuxK